MACFSFFLILVDALRFDYLKNKIIRTRTRKILRAIIIADMSAVYGRKRENVQ